MSEHDRPRQRSEGENSALHELSEDTMGFGQVELRTVWHVLRRPAQVLEAYMVGGATGGGLYSRPLKLYLALNGVLMIVLFFMGGSERQLAAMIPEQGLALALETSGKSRDAFLADADGWMTLFMIPIGAAAYAIAMAPLLRWWDPDDLGWRRAFRAAFAFLNVWTAPMIPIFWLFFLPNTEAVGGLVMFLFAVVAFIRAGKGRWWASLPAGLGKGLVAAFVLQLAALLSLIPVMVLVLLGATYGA